MSETENNVPRAPAYILYALYLSPVCVCVGTRFHGVAVKSKRNKSDPPPSSSFPSILRSFVRSSASSSSSGFLRTAARLVQRKIEAIIPARICSYPFENSFYERNVPVVMRVFVIRRGWCEMRFVEEGCTREGDYISLRVKFLSCLFRIWKKGK